MFIFGQPAEVAELLLLEVAGYAGPGLSAKEFSEFDYEELRAYMIYCSSALRRAAINGLEEEVLMAVCDLYEKSLIAFSLLDDVIWQAMKINEHSYPWNDAAAMERQRETVRAVCEPASVGRLVQS